MSGDRKFKAKQILVVEDSETDVKLIQRALGRGLRPLSVVAMPDGEAALSWLRDPGHAAPDLVIMDLNLPRKDGWELLADCRGDPALKAVPMVVFTTSELGSEVKRCYELGANSFVGKPFEMDDFIRVIQAIEDYWLGVSACP